MYEMKPYYETENGKLYNSNCVTHMFEMEKESIDLTITSPPYDNLREYNGYSFDFNVIANGLFKVIKKGGILVWVVGDQTIKGSETGTSFNQALYFKGIGFNLHDTMIYRKNNHIPLNHNRYDPCFEYMFIFSKGKPKTFNPLLEKCKYAGYNQTYKNRNSASTKEKNGALRPGQRSNIVRSHKFRSNIWSYDVGKNKSTNDDVWEHPAIFPEKLAEDHILSWSNKGDLIFDPMMGSGTVAKMSEVNNRKWLGCETSEKYCSIAAERIEQETKQLKLF